MKQLGNGRSERCSAAKPGAFRKESRPYIEVRVVALCAFLSVALVSTAILPAQSWEERRVNTAYLRQMSRVIASLNGEIEANPKNAKAYYERACIYQNTNMFGHAIKDFTRTLELQPESNAFRRRGISYCMMGDFGKCIEDLTRCVQLEPKDAGAYQWRGYAHDQLNEDKEAIEDLNKSLSIQPEKGAYRTRGCIYVFSGNFKQGIADLNEAIRRNPKDAAALFFRGLAYFNLEHYDQALSQFTESLAAKPEGQVYYYRGRTFMMLRRTDDALKDFESAANYTHEFSSEEMAGNVAKSIKRGAGKEREPYPDRKTARLARRRGQLAHVIESGLTDLKQNKYKEAEQKFSLALSLSSDDFALLSMRARAYFGMKEWKKALQDFTMSLFYENINIDAYIARAAVYAELNQQVKAELDLKRAVVLDPKMASTHFKRAQVLERLKKKSEATSAYREFLKLYSSSSAVKNKELDQFAKIARQRVSKL